MRTAVRAGVRLLRQCRPENKVIQMPRPQEDGNCMCNHVNIC